VAELARYAGRSWNYRDVGATAERRCPRGSRPLEASAHVGTAADLGRAGEFVLGFGMQQGAGFEVVTDVASAVPGEVVLVRMRIGPLRVEAPTRVVRVIEERDRRGFAYGTLDGHPEAGEEEFVVERRGDQLWAAVYAFSRPGRWFTWLGAPVARRLQGRATAAYLASVREHLASTR
jgi:uncharacterized protein (UPF0548 family)